MLAIRPERIVVSASRPPTNGASATVGEIIYRGDHIDVFFRDCPLRVRLPAASPVRPGDTLWLHLPSEHLEAIGE